MLQAFSAERSSALSLTEQLVAANAQILLLTEQSKVGLTAAMSDVGLSTCGCRHASEQYAGGLNYLSCMIITCDYIMCDLLCIMLLN